MKNWTKKTGYNEEDMRGLESIGCLDFIDGIEFEYYEELDNTKSYDILESLYSRLEKFLGIAAKDYGTIIQASYGKLDNAILNNKGVITINGKRIKLTRLIKDDKELMKEYSLYIDKRAKMVCKITSNPIEVLNMSYNRAWTSCMRPDSTYYRGPKTDFIAGSALLLFFRKGSDLPCGREILRPAIIEDNPVIYRSVRIYGNGPLISNEFLSEKLGCEVVRTIPGVLTDNVLLDGCYDDNEQMGISQSEKLFKEVEQKLIEAFRSFNNNWINNKYSSYNGAIKPISKEFQKIVNRKVKLDKKLDNIKWSRNRKLDSQRNKDKVKKKVAFQKMFQKEVSSIFNYFQSFNSYEVRENLEKGFDTEKEWLELRAKVTDKVKEVFSSYNVKSCNCSLYTRSIYITFENNDSVLETQFISYKSQGMQSITAKAYRKNEMKDAHTISRKLIWL